MSLGASDDDTQRHPADGNVCRPDSESEGPELDSEEPEANAAAIT
jgi:hypothetical protein